MDGEEHVQQVPVGNDVWVEVNLDNFGMPRIAIADITVGGVDCVAACITRLNAVDTLDLIINSFQTPEASPSQCCGLKIGIHTITPFRRFLTSYDNILSSNIINKVLQL